MNDSHQTIELRAAIANAEIRHMAAMAMDAVDAILGRPTKTETQHARSLGQLKRWARQRAQRGVKA